MGRQIGAVGSLRFPDEERWRLPLWACGEGHFSPGTQPTQVGFAIVAATSSRPACVETFLDQDAINSRLRILPVAVMGKAVRNSI